MNAFELDEDFLFIFACLTNEGALPIGLAQIGISLIIL